MSIRFSQGFSFGAADLSVTMDIPGQVGLRKIGIIKFKSYDTTNNRTRTLEVKDPDGDTVYSKVDFADNTVTLVSSLAVPLMGGGTLKVTMNAGAPGNAGEDTAVFYEV